MPTPQAISDAIIAHCVWRSILKACLEERRHVDANLVAVAADHHACDFGRWLEGDGAASLRHTPDYALVDRMHREFHQVASDVCTKIMDGRIAEADEMMAARGRFMSSSLSLVDALTDWAERL